MKKKLFSKVKGNGKLKKKVGDDKLVISLVLIAVGVVLCFVYREQIEAVVKSAVLSLGKKITDMFGGADMPGGDTTSMRLALYKNMFKI